MKVGTDGVVLGAWARGGQRILDIGTGCGLIALFMAQRYKNAQVTAIEIDHQAFLQAEENFILSPYFDRITAIETSLQNFRQGKYDAIVCNPPFFTDALKNPERRKAMARHTDTLSFRDLFFGVDALLTEDGEFSSIIPETRVNDFNLEASAFGFFPLRECALRTTPYKQVSRYLLSYGKKPAKKIEETSFCLMNEDKSKSDWFNTLTKDFYL